VLLSIREESPSGESLYEAALEFLTERITVRDLIRERVLHQMRHQPSAIDPEVQVEQAVHGFANNAFFVLIGNEQADRLDQEFTVGPATAVTFVKLIPLVGG